MIRRSAFCGLVGFASGTLLLAACGGGGAVSGPSGPVTLTVVSGETDPPVANAKVVVSGVTHTADSAGRVTLGKPSPLSPIDSVAPGYLDRRSTFRTDTIRFSLWPKTGSTSLTQAVVYTSDSYRATPPGGIRMTRLGERSQIPVVLLGSLPSDAEMTALIQSAIDEANDALAGCARFFLSAPTAGAVLEIEYLPFGQACMCYQGDWAGHGKIQLEEATTREYTLRQITDIYLLGLAKRKEGRLATFDRHIPLRAVVDADQRHLEVIPL